MSKNVKRVFLTGGTGLAGSHIAQKLLADGVAVVALVREGSDASYLEGLGAEIVRGDLTDLETQRQGMKGCDALIHCAALVGEGIPREELFRVNAGGVTKILEAAREAGVHRAIVLSSLAVLGTKAHHGTDESAPYGHTGDPYLESKIAGEQAALEFASDKDYPVTVLRPTQIYGPRDRAFLPVVIENLRRRKMPYVDKGERRMHITHAANVAAATSLALESDSSAGQVYHVTDGVLISRREFVEHICRELPLEPPQVSISYPVMSLACNVFEFVHGLTPSKKPPLLNKYRFKFLACHLDYSIEKARDELGYEPVITPEEGIRESVQWLKEHRPDLFAEPPKPLSPLIKIVGSRELKRRSDELMAEAKKEEATS